MDKIHKYYFLLAILLVLIIGCFTNVKFASSELFSQNFVLDKKLVVITGSSQGLGKEMSKFFNRYLDLKKDEKTIEMIQEEIKLFMFNQKELIMSQKLLCE
jgi:hypothetical protein